ncbi:hypothetical protein ACQR3P_29285 [Rhodococcus sp. IEGM1300]
MMSIKEEMDEKKRFIKSIEAFAGMNYGMLSVIEQDIPQEQRIFLGDRVAELADAVIDNATMFNNRQLLLYQTLLLQAGIIESLLEEVAD